MDLKTRYIAICELYCEHFLRKHGFFDDETGEYYDWCYNDVGSCLEVSDYFISFDEVRYDIDNNVPKERYFEYYDYALEKASEDGGKLCNYASFLKLHDV